MPVSLCHRVASILLTLLCLFPLAGYAADWSDTYLGYRYGTDYREPYNPQDIGKNIFSLTHISGYRYGTNFFNVDMLSSDTADAANGGGGGAHEIYVVYRTTLSFSKISGKSMQYGWIRDVGLTAGVDYSAKDDQFSARVFDTYLGPKISWDVPGFFDTALEYRTEHNHDWFATGPAYGGAGCVVTATSLCNPDVHFKSTYAFESAWGVPFELGTPVMFKGYLVYIGEKGRDGVGQQTKPETLLEVAMMFDVGALAGHKGAFFFGPGYQYWNNKFGNDASLDTTGGSRASVPQLELEIHF